MNKIAPRITHEVHLIGIIDKAASQNAKYCTSTTGPSQAGDLSEMGIGFWYIFDAAAPTTARIMDIAHKTHTQVMSFSKGRAMLATEQPLS